MNRRDFIKRMGSFLGVLAIPLIPYKVFVTKVVVPPKMPTGATFTLMELAKRLDPNGNTIAIANVLAEQNDMLKDALWQPPNDIWMHKTTRTIKLPSGTWRKLDLT